MQLTGQRRALGAVWCSAMISVVAAGCDPHTGPGEPGLDLRIGTDRLEYSLSSDSAVYVALVNTGVDTVYMWAPSFNRRLEIWRHFEWRDLGPWYLIVAGGFVLVPVVPGDSLPDDVPLPLASEIIPGPGLYRFAFTVYRDPDLTELLPVALRVSNVFKLVD